MSDSGLKGSVGILPGEGRKRVIPANGRECEKWLWAGGLGKHAVLENRPGEEFHKTLNSYIVGDSGCDQDDENEHDFQANNHIYERSCSRLSCSPPHHFTEQHCPSQN